jgi:hypothetical protein
MRLLVAKERERVRARERVRVTKRKRKCAVGAARNGRMRSPPGVRFRI